MLDGDKLLPQIQAMAGYLASLPPNKAQLKAVKTVVEPYLATFGRTAESAMVFRAWVRNRVITPSQAREIWPEAMEVERAAA